MQVPNACFDGAAREALQVKTFRFYGVVFDMVGLRRARGPRCGSADSSQTWSPTCSATCDGRRAPGLANEPWADVGYQLNALDLASGVDPVACVQPQGRIMFVQMAGCR